jgi:hypothetical protein
LFLLVVFVLFWGRQAKGRWFDASAERKQSIFPASLLPTTHSACNNQTNGRTHPLKLHLALEPLVRQRARRLVKVALADERDDAAAQRVDVAGRQLEDLVFLVFDRGLGWVELSLLLWMAGRKARGAQHAAKRSARTQNHLRSFKLTLLGHFERLAVLLVIDEPIELVKQGGEFGLLILRGSGRSRSSPRHFLWCAACCLLLLCSRQSCATMIYSNTQLSIQNGSSCGQTQICFVVICDDEHPLSFVKTDKSIRTL